MTTEKSKQLVDHFFRHEYAKLVATLTRKFGVRHWELVEDVVQSALQRALRTWSHKGVPDNPTAWLHRVAANLAIDTLRRDARSSSLESQDELQSGDSQKDPAESTAFEDDQLRMMFLCCDPRVPAESQIALALKTLCGFGNFEIARALLSTEVSIAKRITRAKQTLRSLGLELAELNEAEVSTRLGHVMSVVYLLFNEGYNSSISDRLIREELVEEAVRLAFLLATHKQTTRPETAAMLALMLFHAARLEARIDDTGAMLLMKEQDRSKWDQRLIKEAFHWFHTAAESETLTRYHAEAWIAAEHCRAKNYEGTNWARIEQGYELLCKLAPSPVHELNRAIAIGKLRGAEAGLKVFESIDSNGLAKDYYLWHATRAEFARQTGKLDIAKAALQTAWKLAPTNAEKELICRKLDRL